MLRSMFTATTFFLLTAGCALPPNPMLVIAPLKYIAGEVFFGEEDVNAPLVNGPITVSDMLAQARGEGRIETDTQAVTEAAQAPATRTGPSNTEISVAHVDGAVARTDVFRIKAQILMTGNPEKVHVDITVGANGPTDSNHAVAVALEAAKDLADQIETIGAPTSITVESSQAVGSIHVSLNRNDGNA